MAHYKIFIGEGEGIRTLDTQIKSLVHYRLCYTLIKRLELLTFLIRAPTCEQYDYFRVFAP